MSKLVFTTIVTRPILAGGCISLGAYAFLHTQGIIGTILFSIGLIAVLYYHFSLYTGIIHEVKNSIEFLCCLFIILPFNIIGCWLASLLVTNPEIVSLCEHIVMQRATFSFGQAIIHGMGCGFLVTLAVQGWKRNKIALLIGIPAFILAGFTHSVADAFYYCVGWKATSWNALYAYCGTVLGNFIGGSIHKFGITTFNN